MLIFLLLISISYSLKCGEYNTDTLNITAFSILVPYKNSFLAWVSFYDYKLGISTTITCDKYNTEKLIIKDKIISIIDPMNFEVFLMSKTGLYYYNYEEEPPRKILSLKDGQNFQPFKKVKDNKSSIDIYILNSGEIIKLKIS